VTRPVRERAVRLLVALLVPLALLGLAEIGFRLAEDPASAALFQRVERDGRVLWQRSPSRNLPWYPPYAQQKPAGTLRVACIGGSTVEGNPSPECAFPRVLERRLSAALAPRPVEVMGCGVGGQHSDGELAVLHQVLDFDPDLVVLYSAHNEFHPQHVADLLDEARNPGRAALRSLLRRSALGRALLRATAGAPRVAPSLADAPPDHRPIDGPEYGLVVERFRENVESFVGACAARGIPVVLCTSVSNLRDFPPMADVHRAGLSEDERLSYDACLDAARTALAAGDAVRALGQLDRAATIDDLPAGLCFLRGRALLLAGRAPEAAACFRLARDRDGRANRATTELNRVMLGFAGRPGVIVADVEADFCRLAPDGIVGSESIVDNVHPTVSGQAEIAELILRELARAGVIVDQAALERAGPASASLAGMAVPDDAESARRIGVNNLLLALEQGRSGAAATQAREQLEQAQRLEPGRADTAVGLGLVCGLDGDAEGSRTWFARALSADATALGAWAKAARESRLVEGLFRRGGIRFEGDTPQPLP